MARQRHNPIENCISGPLAAFALFAEPSPPVTARRSRREQPIPNGKPSQADIQDRMSARRVRWLALHCESEGCSDWPSRSSSQEDEPWRTIEKPLSESMSRS